MMALMEQLALLSQPMLQAGGIAALGLALLLRRRHRLGAATLLLGIGWLWLCATPSFAHWLERGLTPNYPAAVAETYPTADAIVVLGGGLLPLHDEPLSENTRLGFGLRLYRQQRAPVIVLSGSDQALKMAALLRQQGVPDTALLVEAHSVNTHQNAVLSAQLLARHHLREVLLVTSSIHMTRALASFREQGVAATAAATPGSELDTPSSHYRWWPSRAALRLSGHCLREYVGLRAYRWFGWIPGGTEHAPSIGIANAGEQPRPGTAD